MKKKIAELDTIKKPEIIVESLRKIKIPADFLLVKSLSDLIEHQSIVDNIQKGLNDYIGEFIKSQVHHIKDIPNIIPKHLHEKFMQQICSISVDKVHSEFYRENKEYEACIEFEQVKNKFKTFNDFCINLSEVNAIGGMYGRSQNIEYFLIDYNKYCLIPFSGYDKYKFIDKNTKIIYIEEHGVWGGFGYRTLEATVYVNHIFDTISNKYIITEPGGFKIVNHRY